MTAVDNGDIIGLHWEDRTNNEKFRPMCRLEKNMAISDSQRKAVAKYNAANYDRIELRVDKGRKDIIKAHAEGRGESVNGFINRAIEEAMERETALD